MEFMRLHSAERDTWVERRFGLDRQAVEGYSSGHRVVVIIFDDRLPPKLVILREGDILKFRHANIAVYDRVEGCWVK